MKTVDDKGSIISEIIPARCDPFRSIPVDNEVMPGRIVFISSHYILLKFFPERKVPFMNKVSLLNQLCPFTIHFPALMQAGNLIFSAFFLFLLTFRIQPVNLPESNALSKWHCLFRISFRFQKLCAYTFMTDD